MKEELTKSGKPVSQKTFGILVCNDKLCRHSAVELGFFDPDLRLFGRYLHYSGYRTIKEAQQLMAEFVDKKINPYEGLKPKSGQVIDFHQWKNRKSR
ncbi:MAG: hypothetical protein ACWA5U_11090 [bacterium]